MSSNSPSNRSIASKLVGYPVHFNSPVHCWDIGGNQLPEHTIYTQQHIVLYRYPLVT